jgi:tRNA/rRNA methyltransferase
MRHGRIVLTKAHDPAEMLLHGIRGDAEEEGGGAMTGAGTDHTKPKLEGGPAIVLVRPQLAVNIGMCARAMANFGLSDLRLVAPREGWPRTDPYGKEAYAAAAGAVHLLESVRVYESVREAIEDLSFVYAATARGRGQMKPVHTPEKAMQKTAALMALGERHGVLFGPERTGLDNDEVALADAILTFPVNPAYASLNLAQAVLLTGYEWFRAALGDAIPFDVSERSPPATREMTLAFFDFLESELDKRQFFRPATKKPIMSRNLRNMFHRMSLTEQDVRTLWGVVVRLVEGPRREPKNPKRRKSPPAETSEPPRGPD